ncbi:MAG: hydrogenase expression/formation protein HypE [Lachnospiraceae bacterium]|nr:hydrogenase expression/formation protein HypE [Lachnospiraceae bacterium]
MIIDISYGSGGKQTSNMIQEIFMKQYDNEILRRMEDAAVVQLSGDIAFTTDSFVVTPVFFPGGDIGRLSVCGTVNDLAMMGAVPKYLTVGFIIETGTDTETINTIAYSMKLAAQEADIQIVAGDTKVIEGTGNIYINTAGIGTVIKKGVSISNCCEDDMIILSGNLGDHHATILSERMGIHNNITSDCAPLGAMVKELIDAGVEIHCMRDITRGGLATVLNEVAEGSSCGVEIVEKDIPVDREVQGFCNILGLDPLYMGNEGKMIAVIPNTQGQKAIEIMKKNKYGTKAQVIGKIVKGKGVTMITTIGGSRVVDVLYGEGLPRIC